MCRIQLLATFRMNVGVPDPTKKIYMRKTILFEYFTNFYQL